MKFIIKYMFFFIFYLFFSVNILATTSWEKGESKAENLEFYINLYTPGADLFSWWGHISLVIKDKKTNEQMVYDWGTFDFDNPFKLAKNFVQNKLLFTASANYNVMFQQKYYVNIERRGLSFIQLNIPIKQRIFVAKAISTNVLPQNKIYQYQYFIDNCSTKIRDYVNILLNGELEKIAKNTKQTMSIRDHVRRITSRNIILEYGIDFLLNSTIDKKVTLWEEMFLPDILAKNLLQLNYNNDKIAHLIEKKESKLFNYNLLPKNYYPYDLYFSIGLCLFFIISIFSIKSTKIKDILFSLYLLIIGLFSAVNGLLLTMFMFFTEHYYTYKNENIFLSNIFTFLFIFIAIYFIYKIIKKGEIIYKYKKIHIYIFIFSCIALCSPIIKLFTEYQNNFIHLRLYIPLYLGLIINYAYNYIAKNFKLCCIYKKKLG